MLDAPPVTIPAVKVEMEKHQQQEEKVCVQMETAMATPPELKGQPALQDRPPVCPVPTTTAGSAFSDSMEVASADTDVNETEKLKTEVAADVTASPEGSENVKEEPSPSVTSADKQTIPAASAATSSVAAPAKLENAAEFPPFNEDMFKALTSALKQHRLAKESRTKSDDKESANISKAACVKSAKEEDKQHAESANMSKATCVKSAKEEDKQHAEAQDVHKEEESDIFDEFEFNFEEFVTVDEISEDMSEAATDDGSSIPKQPPTKGTEGNSSNVSPVAKKTSSKDSACSTSSSKSTKRSSSSRSTSESDKKQNRSSEHAKTKPTESVEASASSGQKAQPSRTKSSARASQSSSTGRSTRSSSSSSVSVKAGTRLSHEKEAKPPERAARQSGHKESAESDAAKTVESETKPKTSGMDAAAQGQKSESPTQTQSLESDFEDKAAKDLKKSKEKENVVGTTEERGDYNENDRTMHSLDEKTDDQANMEEDNRNNKTKTTGPEEDRVDNDGKMAPEDHREMEIDVQVSDSAGKNQAATADDKDEDSAVIQAEEVVQSSDKPSDTADKHQALDQVTRSVEDGTKGKQEQEIISKALSETSKDVDQTSDDQLLENDDGKESEQEVLETMNSADGRTVPEGEGQKPGTPGDQIFKADIGSTEEVEEEVYQIIDSLEDQPTETELETDKKRQTRKGKTTLREGRPTRSGCSRSRTSKNEDEGKSSKKLDKTVKKYETRTKDSTTGKEKKTDQSNEEKVFELVDSAEDKSVQEASECSDGRQGDGEKTVTSIEMSEQSDKEEETMYKILDSVEDEAVGDKPALTRSIRGRSRRTAEQDAEKDTKQDKTRTRRRHTPVTDAPETSGVPPKEATPAKNKGAVVKDTSEEETAYEILDAVEEDVVEEIQSSSQKPRRGRSKKTPTTKQAAALKKVDTSEAAEEETYQILDSVEDDQPAKGQAEKTGTSSIKSPRNELEEEAFYQVVDSVEDDQLVSSSKETSGRAENEDSLLQLADDVEKVKHDPPAHTGRRTSTPASKKTRKSKKNDSTSTNLLVQLDVASEVEDRLDTATSEKQEGKQTSAREPGSERSERETRERRSRSSSSRRGDGRKTMSRTKEERQESEEKVEAELQELVTVDEVGDETGEEGVTDAPSSDREVLEGELQDLLTLDEIVEEENEKEEHKLEALCLENQSVASSKPQTLSTSGEADDEDTKNTSSSVKRKHDGDTEKSDDFVTVDELVMTEEEEPAAATRGQPKKRSRQAPVRKSVRGQTMSKETKREEEEHNASAELCIVGGDTSAPSGDVQPESPKTEVEPWSKSDVVAASSELEPQPEPPGGQKPPECEEEKEERSKAEVKEKSDDFVTVDELVMTEEEEPAAATRGQPKKRSRQAPVRKSVRGQTMSKETKREEEEHNASAELCIVGGDTSAPSGDVQPESPKTEV
ncbi:myb-like protein X [Nematolebias whitei]|uniref:myb-like protein X n=1 Tax=Nematolebias whitei TaxID=451745 RepID=UPI001899D750|nr:myb-like protein X [Nematolebias whitei]